MLIRFVLLYLATLALGDDKIHKRMSPDEVQQIFQTSHESVPDYEVVQFSVSRLVKRGTRSARLIRALHKIPFENNDLSLWIKPADGHVAGKNTPVYRVSVNNQGHIEYREHANGLRNIGQLMEDPPSGASMMVTKDQQGRYHINGVVRGKRLVIRSLPNEMADRLLQNHPSRDRRSAYHVVFRQERSGRGNGKGQDNQVAGTSTASATPYDECIDPIPANQTVVYPEIMLVLDSIYYENNRNNINNILTYAVTFWNGVDLFYRSVQQPKFRFNLKYIIIAETPEAVPYINDHLVDRNRYIYHPDAVKHTGEYYFSLQKIPPLSYDAVFTLVGKKLVKKDDDRPDKWEFAEGISVFKGACRAYKDYGGVWNLAIVHDNRAYEGVHTAAHEFGHLVGALHDDYTREPGCRESDGYIMAENDILKDGATHDFSHCSINEIQRFLNRGWSRCLFNEPVTVNPLKRTLPGQHIDRNQQCHMEGHGNDCFNENNRAHQPCVRIYCRSGSQCQEIQLLVPDGGFCGRGKKCFHGKCVSGFPA